MWILKNLNILNLDDKLEAILVDLVRIFGPLRITSAFRPGDEGVHGEEELRGIDLECPDKIIGMRIEGVMEKRWQYDWTRPGKKCVIWHDVGKGPHLHCQSHPNTKFIGRRGP